jgi:CheY-like chemotaxis protein
MTQYEPESQGMSTLLVLVAEDNEVSRKLLIRQLENLGLEVQAVESGKDALDAFERKCFAAIFMNYEMPVMDGLTATQKIRALEIENKVPLRTPIIAVTAKTIPVEKQRCLDAGMDDVLSRPFNSAELSAVVKRWIPELASAPTPARGSDQSIETFDSLNAITEPQLHQAFRNSLGGLMNRLYVAIYKQDGEETNTIAHEMKGLCLSCGYPELSGWCSQIEKALMLGDWAQVQANSNALIDSYKDSGFQ